MTVVPAISVDELKSVCGKTDTDADAWFEQETAGATRRAERFMGQNIVEQAVTLTFYGDGADWRLVPGAQINGVISLKYRGAGSVKSSDYQTVSSDDYALEQTEGGAWMVKMPALFVAGYQYELVVARGWKEVPEDIATAVKVIGVIDYAETFLSGGEKLLMFNSIARNFGGNASASNGVKSAEELEYIWQSPLMAYRFTPV